MKYRDFFDSRMLCRLVPSLDRNNWAHAILVWDSSPKYSWKLNTVPTDVQKLSCNAFIYEELMHETLTWLSVAQRFFQVAVLLVCTAVFFFSKIQWHSLWRTLFFYFYYKYFQENIFCHIENACLLQSLKLHKTVLSITLKLLQLIAVTFSYYSW